ncbi:MAG: NADH-quinone oxidoreductase subunit C [Bacteroidales bacterium]|nr:NADH-quinone oxidoreductase subunit C [Bacteroidales bacterium]
MMQQNGFEQILKSIFPEITLSKCAQFNAIELKPESIYAGLEKLHQQSDLKFDMLVCLTAVDRVTHIEVLYHLRSTFNGYDLIVKTALVEQPYELQSVVPLWRSAELFEMEIYDMFGISFSGHPDLRRLFMPDDWEGFPLRKSYKTTDVADNYLDSHKLLLNQQE